MPQNFANEPHLGRMGKCRLCTIYRLDPRNQAARAKGMLSPVAVCYGSPVDTQNEWGLQTVSALFNGINYGELETVYRECFT